ALETGASSPGVECGVRCRDCAPRILAAALRHRAERLTGCRTGGLGGRTAPGVAPSAGDEHPCRNGVSLSARWCESTSESMEDIADFLRARPPFDSLDEETLGEIAASAEIEFRAARRAIFDSPGAVLEHGYVVRRGSVELVIEGRLIDLIGEGEIFGFVSLLSEGPPGFVARAAEDTLVYRLPAAVMRPVLERPAFVRFVTEVMNRRVRLLARHETEPPASSAGRPVGELI